MKIDPLATGIQQVCMVVENCDETIRNFVEKSGIGPWAVWTYGPHNLSNMRVRGVETPYSMRLAIAWTKGFRWEIIQPLEGRSIYREFLEEHGEGVHHVLIDYDGRDFDAAVEEFRKRGCPPLMEGRMTERDIDFVYVQTDGPLKVVMELSRRGPGSKRLPPDYWYPYALPEFPSEPVRRLDAGSAPS
ncbi:VOC family protein [Ottowia thiooxydans]